MISLSFAIIFSQTLFDRSLVRLLVRSVFIFDRFFRSIVGSCVRSFDRLFVCPFVYVLLNSFSVLMTGGMDPRCKICIFMGKTDPDAPKHKQQVMLANTITNVVLVISNFQFLSQPISMIVAIRTPCFLHGASCFVAGSFQSLEQYSIQRLVAHGGRP